MLTPTFPKSRYKFSSNEGRAMQLPIDVDLDTESLDIVVSKTVSEGETVSWSELVELRNRIDRVLEQRDRIERQRRASV